jgi:hypothetical protein
MNVKNPAPLKRRAVIVLKQKCCRITIFNLMWRYIILNICSGLLLALILFLLKEYIFAKRNLSGGWNAKLKIIESSYGPYNNLTLYYEIHLLQKGYELSGTGEKVKEVNNKNELLEYERNKRVTIELDGYYEHNYFKKSNVYLNIIEKGRKRESRSTYTLNIESGEKLKGTFDSTAADSKGEIIIERF